LGSLAATWALFAACTSSELSAAREKALKGDAQAQLELAQMYLYGKGAKQDHEEAAKQGDPEAKAELAAMPDKPAMPPEPK